MGNSSLRHGNQRINDNRFIHLLVNPGAVYKYVIEPAKRTISTLIPMRKAIYSHQYLPPSYLSVKLQRHVKVQSPNLNLASKQHNLAAMLLLRCRGKYFK